MKQNAKCLLCSSRDNQPASSYYDVYFNESNFHYLACNHCNCLFIDPIPSNDDFLKMYQNESYHEQHYVDTDISAYLESAKLLSKFAVPQNTRVLDFGCGYGHFLKALVSEGFSADGLEFDKAACHKAEIYSGCRVRNTSEMNDIDQEQFDVIHLGDVLEHLPDPHSTMKKLMKKLRDQGLIFIEGPIETNPSLVFWSRQTYGLIKKILIREKKIGKPTHLIKVNASTQLNFIMELSKGIQCLHWEVYESGWPYHNGGMIKHSIALMAKRLGGKRLFTQIMGNRFKGIFQVGQN